MSLGPPGLSGKHEVGYVATYCPTCSAEVSQVLVCPQGRAGESSREDSSSLCESSTSSPPPAFTALHAEVLGWKGSSKQLRRPIGGAYPPLSILPGYMEAWHFSKGECQASALPMSHIPSLFLELVIEPRT